MKFDTVINVDTISVTIVSDELQNFTVFVIEVLSETEALYKPCSGFEGVFKQPNVVFVCNQGTTGFVGDYVYIKDNRQRPRSFTLCEVEVYSHASKYACGSLETPTEMILYYDEFKAEYSCQEDSKVLVGSSVRLCSPDTGQWEGNEPWCDVISGENSDFGKV